MPDDGPPKADDSGRAWRHAGAQTQVCEDLLDHRLFQDGHDDLQLAAAVRAVLQVEIEHPLEQPGTTRHGERMYPVEQVERLRPLNRKRLPAA